MTASETIKFYTHLLESYVLFRIIISTRITKNSRAGDTVSKKTL